MRAATFDQRRAIQAGRQVRSLLRIVAALMNLAQSITTAAMTSNCFVPHVRSSAIIWREP